MIIEIPIGGIPVIPGVVIRSRPVGVLLMEDESGLDEKILCVPVDELHHFYQNIGSYRDLRPILIDQIAHFFEHYKDIEPGKWVKMKRWGEGEEAMDLIKTAMLQAEQQAEQRAG